MARKKTANGRLSPLPSDENAVDAASSSAAPSTPRIDIVAASAGVQRDVIKVNNVNLSDLKNSCDDVVKRLLSQPELFQQNHTHTDVKLGLGWASVIVAAGTALYGWKVEFEKSKPLVWAGVILYVLLTSLSTLYSFFVEKDTVYVGKRKTLAKRIETERITVASSTVPSKPNQPPRYKIDLTYVRSSNGGKSLLGRGAGADERGYNEFFDEEGTMDQLKFERWVGGLVERVMEER